MALSFSFLQSPILSHFHETIHGASSIRAYRCQDRFVWESEDRVSENTKCHYLGQCITQWLGIRIEAIGSLVVFSAALLSVLSRDSISPGLAGLSVMYSLEVMEALSWMVQMACNLENNSVALERIMEYFGLEQEANWEKDTEQENWYIFALLITSKMCSQFRY